MAMNTLAHFTVQPRPFVVNIVLVHFVRKFACTSFNVEF
jgi:hypothetical protein